jgi:hypothetical protein
MTIVHDRALEAEADRLAARASAIQPNPTRSPFPIQPFRPETYKARAYDSPEYGWVTGLANWLNQKIGKGKWAFTGSFAMYCWAHSKDGTTREPDDVDILVEDGCFDAAAYGLNGTGEFLFSGGPPGINTAHVKLRGQAEAKFDIDVLRAGPRFGTLDNMTFLNGKDTFPVVSIADLIARKHDILEDDEDDPKSLRDLKLLEALL